MRRQHAQGADFIKAALTNRGAFLAANAQAKRLGLPLAGHLPEDIDPGDVARADVSCVEHLGPGIPLYAASSTEEDHLRPHPGRSLPLPNIKLPGVDTVFNKMLMRLVTNPSAMTSPQTAEALRTADRTFSASKAHELAQLFAEHRTWQCPMLIRLHTQQFPMNDEHFLGEQLEYILPAEVRRWRGSANRFARLPRETQEALQAHWEAQLTMTQIFGAEGVPMLAGTDAFGAARVIPGFGLHDEFDLLGEAGLSPLQIMQSATSAPAHFFDREDTMGAIKPGFGADMVLLNSDPLADHRALHDISAVLREGMYFDRSALDGVLDRIREHPAVH